MWRNSEKIEKVFSENDVDTLMVRCLGDNWIGTRVNNSKKVILCWCSHQCSSEIPWHRSDLKKEIRNSKGTVSIIVEEKKWWTLSNLASIVVRKGLKFSNIAMRDIPQLHILPSIASQQNTCKNMIPKIQKREKKGVKSKRIQDHHSYHFANERPNYLQLLDGNLRREGVLSVLE